jgi:hypothetical protein
VGTLWTTGFRTLLHHSHIIFKQAATMPTEKESQISPIVQESAVHNSRVCAINPCQTRANFAASAAS